jgi:hypothetical protein
MAPSTLRTRTTSRTTTTFSHTKAYGDARDAVVSPDKLTLPGYPAFLTFFLGDGPPDAAFV